MYFADCVRVSIIVIYLKVIKGSFIIDGFGVADSEGVGVVAKDDLQRRARKMLDSIKLFSIFHVLGYFGHFSFFGLGYEKFQTCHKGDDEKF